MRFKAKDQYTPGLLMSSIVFSCLFFIPFRFIQNHYDFKGMSAVLIFIFVIAISSIISFLIYQLLMVDVSENINGDASAGLLDLDQDSYRFPEITIFSVGFTLLITILLFFCFTFLI